MSNVVHLPPLSARTAVAKPDDTLALARKIRNAAIELAKAVDDLERDGCQIGSDAIGGCLKDLYVLADEWFRPFENPLPDFDPEAAL